MPAKADIPIQNAPSLPVTKHHKLRLLQRLAALKGLATLTLNQGRFYVGRSGYARIFCRMKVAGIGLKTLILGMAIGIRPGVVWVPSSAGRYSAPKPTAIG